MATSQPDIAFVVNARDKASAVFEKITRSSNVMGSAWRGLVGIIARMNVAMLALSVTLPIVAAAFASLITVTTAINFVTFERGMRRTRIQMQLLGLSAEQARSQVATLAGLMDRAAATSFFTSAEAINTIAIAGFELTKQLIPLATEFAELAGLDPGKVFVALFDAVAKHNPDKFSQLVLGMTDLAIPIEIFASLEAGDVQPFLDFLAQISSNETVSGTEKVAKNLKRIADITLPARERIVEVASVIVNVLLESLAERLEAVREQLTTILILAWGAAVVASGSSLGRRLGLGLMVGVAGILLVDFATTMEEVFANPALTAAIIAIAFTLGRQIGGKKGGMVAGIVFIMGIELLPGLSDMFRDLRFSQQLDVAAFGTGVIIGLAMKRGILNALTLGVIFQTVIDDFKNDKNGQQTTAVVGFTLLGGILGARFGGGFTGFLVGALIGNMIGEILADPNTEEKAKEWGLAVGRFFLDDFQGIFIELPIILANEMIKAINDAIARVATFDFFGRTFALPEIPQIPVPDPFGVNQTPPSTSLAPDFLPTATGVAAQRARVETAANLQGALPFDPDEFEHGGTVPGPLGAPRMAIVHGGEVVIPGGGIVIQLVLDKRVIQEVAVDGVNRVARFNAGMVPGAIGS